MSALDHLKGMLSGVAEKGQGGTATGPAASLPVDALSPSRYQPRRHFDQKELAALADSIREKGVLQPLLVRVTDRGHEIVAGERRWRAAQLAGLRDVPVYIRQMTDQDARLFGLMENLQRADLTPFDEIEAKLEAVGAALGISAEQAKTKLNELTRNPEAETVEVLEHLFRQLGRETWESYARNKLRVFGWPEPILQAMREGLSFTVAGVVAAAPEELQADLLALALRGASRTELKEEIKRAQKPKKIPPSRAERVAKQLTNRKWLAKLGPEDSESLQQWLAQMPRALRLELGEE